MASSNSRLDLSSSRRSCSSIARMLARASSSSFLLSASDLVSRAVAVGVVVLVLGPELVVGPAERLALLQGADVEVDGGGLRVHGAQGGILSSSSGLGVLPGQIAGCVCGDARVLPCHGIVRHLHQSALCSLAPEGLDNCDHEGSHGHKASQPSSGGESAVCLLLLLWLALLRWLLGTTSWAPGFRPEIGAAYPMKRMPVGGDPCVLGSLEFAFVFALQSLLRDVVFQALCDAVSGCLVLRVADLHLDGAELLLEAGDLFVVVDHGLLRVAEVCRLLSAWAADVDRWDPVVAR